MTSRSDVGPGPSSRRNLGTSHRIRTENPGHFDIVAADVRVRCCPQCRAFEVAPQVLRRGFRLEPDVAEIPATDGLLADEVAHGGAWPPLVEECSHADDVVREVAERIVRETTLSPSRQRAPRGLGIMFHGARSPCTTNPPYMPARAHAAVRGRLLDPHAVGPFSSLDDVGDEREGVVLLTVPTQHGNLQGRLDGAERRERRRLPAKPWSSALPTFTTTPRSSEPVSAYSQRSVPRTWSAAAAVGATPKSSVTWSTTRWNSGAGNDRCDVTGRSLAMLRAATRALGVSVGTTLGRRQRRRALASTRPRVGGA